MMNINVITPAVAGGTLDGKVLNTHSRFSEVKNEMSLPVFKFGHKDDVIDTSQSDDSVLCNSHNTFMKLSENAPTKEIEVPADMVSDSLSVDYEIVSVSSQNISKSNVITAECVQPSHFPLNVEERIKQPENLKQSVNINTNNDKSRVVVQILTSKLNAHNFIKPEPVFENKKFTQNTVLCSFREDVFNILGKANPVDNVCNINGLKTPVQTEECSGIKYDDDLESSCDFKTHEQQTFEENALSNKNSSVKFKSHYQRLGQRKQFVQRKNGRNFDRAVPANFCYYRLNRNKRSLKVKDEFRKENFIRLNYSKSKGVGRSQKRSHSEVDSENIGGKMLYEIDFIANNIHNASTNLLRILHYVLFDNYGPCTTNMQLSQTKENILFFGGYSFKHNSTIYLKKKNCLLRLPFPILAEMYKIIFGKDKKCREEMVAELINFFMKPTDESENCDIFQKTYSSEEYECMKKLALQEPPVVVMKNLTAEEIDHLSNQLKLQNTDQCNDTDSSDLSTSPPPYILKGPGKKLKSFPDVIRQIKNADNATIETLHYLLYGRCESREASQRNILEFSGFLPCQKEFINQRRTLLNNLGSLELFRLSEVLCLNAKTNCRSIKIKKIIKFLSKPRVLINRRLNAKARKVVQSGFQSHETQKPSFIVKKDTTGTKLRDFKMISSNIECASPSDLTELNDLLFIKPCDESEIHQKILDFSQFDFSVNSMEYHYRKTLMYYMSFCIIKKIAQLLDIKNWDKTTCQSDLSLNILNFLMDMKNPGTNSCKALQPSQAVQNNHSGTKITSKNTKSNIFQIFERKVEEKWCFHNSPTPQSQNLTSGYTSASDNSTSLQNQAITTVEKHVLIHRLTKSGEDNKDLNNQTCGSMSSTPSPKYQNEEDATPLRLLLHHPSDQELKGIINKIIKSDLFNITMGTLVHKVYELYPDLNISYRENFIKTEARQMLSQLRSNAVDTLNSIQCKLSDVI